MKASQAGGKKYDWEMLGQVQKKKHNLKVPNKKYWKQFHLWKNFYYRDKMASFYLKSGQ